MLNNLFINELRYEKARRSFWEYCKLKAPKFYKEDRLFLKDLANKLQCFIDGDQSIIVVNLPPRHGKSRTATLFVQWLLGKNNKNKVMTGSYNELLSTTFAKQVRDAIQEEDGLYKKIFPNTSVKRGEASMNKWALEKSEEANYLATSPTGTATGFGANIIIIDDLIKNEQEAYSELVLDKHKSWFTNTMLSRTEQNFKIIIIMTRWADNDLAGFILNEFENVEHVNYKAVKEDGNMLCDEILNKKDFELKTKNMNEDIISANYNQEPINIKGVLYTDLKEYNQIKDFTSIECYTDTADMGADYLCAIIYAVKDTKAYILDVVYTQKGMEETEPLLAEKLFKYRVNYCRIESNNGGRGFGRNVKRLTENLGNNITRFNFFTQTKNKEARMLTNATGVMNNIYFPQEWKIKFKEFYRDTTKYQRLGKNKHDDCIDALTGVYENLPKKDIYDSPNLWG
ncbi:MAG: phage terminase large subunit [Clostridia bacterium]